MEQTVRSNSTDRRLSRVRGWRLFAVAFFIAAVILVVVRHFFFDIFFIPSESMEPTLESGDRIVVEKSYDDIARGDIVVFDGTGSFDPYQSASPWATDPVRTAGQWLGIVGSDTIYVKRVIGVGGDKVSCCGPSGKISVNGQEIDEPYLATGMKASEQKFTVQVPEGRLWVMGDNRNNSRDSRALLGSAGGGMIRQEKVLGESRWIIWPFSRWQTINQDSASS